LLRKKAKALLIRGCRIILHWRIQNAALRFHKLLLPVELQHLASLQTQSGSLLYRYEWHPITRHLTRQLVDRFPSRRRLRRWLCCRALLLETVQLPFGRALDYALDSPGHVRHFVAQEQHFFNRTTFQTLHQRRRQKEKIQCWFRSTRAAQVRLLKHSPTRVWFTEL